MRLWISFCIAIVCVFSDAYVGESSGSEIRWWTASALEKVRPYTPAPPGPAQSVDISAALNEFEPFQIIVRAESDDLAGVRVELSDFAGPGGSVLAKGHATVYFQHFLNLSTPSSIEGATGEWPDPLIPAVDRYVGETRKAFPFTVKRGRNQPIWVEIYVPPKTLPGKYRATAIISALGRNDARIPINLRVWNFALPSTSSLVTSFGFNGVTALKQHRGSYTSDEELFHITGLYAKAALLHRVSTHGGSMTPPPWSFTGGNLQIDWSRYDQEVGPLLNGTALSSKEPLYGARATSIDLRTESSLDTDEKKILYWREWTRHFKEKGWFDRLFNYVWDEPPLKDYSKVLASGRIARRADPKLSNLVTAPQHEQLSEVIDLWVPLINCFEAKPGFAEFCPQIVTRESRERETHRGKSLWWYQSCASHGCSGDGGEYFRGWPSYMIDASGTSNRIMQWLTWSYGIQGELYFSMNDSFGRDTDPWDNIFMHGGNGDGTLFYPGRPERIGGVSHIPIESIRLKLIREGLEDYEYLSLLRRQDPEAAQFVERCVKKLVRTTYSWERQPAVLLAVRRELGDELDRRERAAKAGPRALTETAERR